MTNQHADRFELTVSNVPLPFTSAIICLYTYLQYFAILHSLTWNLRSGTKGRKGSGLPKLLAPNLPSPPMLTILLLNNPGIGKALAEQPAPGGALVPSKNWQGSVSHAVFEALAKSHIETTLRHIETALNSRRHFKDVLLMLLASIGNGRPRLLEIEPEDRFEQDKRIQKAHPYSNFLQRQNYNDAPEGLGT